MSALPKLGDMDRSIAHIEAGMETAGYALAVEWAYSHGDKTDLDRAMVMLSTAIERMERTRTGKQSLRAKFAATFRKGAKNGGRQ